MINNGLGLYKHQKISRVTPSGYYIDVAEGTAFLPSKNLEQTYQENEEIEVFIYHDKDGHLTATIVQPIIQLLQCDLVKIKSALDSGAFADIGIERDLFIPHAEQYENVLHDEILPVVMYYDDKSGRIAGSTKVDNYLNETMEPDSIKVGEGKELLIIKKTELGFKAVFDKTNIGMLYHSDLKLPVDIGMKVVGYVRNHRDDGKVDLTLRKPGFNEILDAKEQILQKLGEENGFLPYHDKSDPDEIRAKFGMSKRTFKAAVGNMLKEGSISLDDTGIKVL
jgi:predicted RNA-binding protein (virulence factor B family)